MALVLDTARLAERDRRDVLVSTVREAADVSRIELADGEPVHARLDLWWFGGAALLRVESNGMAFIRTAKAARAASGEHIAIGVHEFGVARYQVGSITRVVGGGDVLVVDVSRPFDFGWHGRGAAHSINTSAGQLALPADLVRKASQRLASSPLYGMVSRHIADLARNADALSASSTAGALGSASIELVRALMVTALEDTPGSRDVIEQTLITQIRAHVRQHLHDPDLSPESIAAALSISPRHLYRVCANANMRLEQWIISARLDNAKAELAHPSAQRRPIATIARRWGFKDPTHFARRFRAAHGILPSDWRRSCTEQRAESS